MKTLKPKQAGFGVVELIVVIAILAILGGVGWLVWHSRQATTNSSSTSGNTAAPAPKATDTITIKFNKSKLPEKWTQIPKSDGTLELNSSYYGSDVSIKKVNDRAVKASSADSFIAQHRPKASTATETTYGNTLLPNGELTVATNKGGLQLTSYIYETRDYKDNLLSTHAEAFIVRDGCFVVIDETINSGQSLSNAAKVLSSVTFNL